MRTTYLIGSVSRPEHECRAMVTSIPMLPARVVDHSTRGILCLGSDQAAEKSGAFDFDLGVYAAADAAVQSEIGHTPSLSRIRLEREQLLDIPLSVAPLPHGLAGCQHGVDRRFFSGVHRQTPPKLHVHDVFGAGAAVRSQGRLPFRGIPVGLGRSGPEGRESRSVAGRRMDVSSRLLGSTANRNTPIQRVVSMLPDVGSSLQGSSGEHQTTVRVA